MTSRANHSIQQSVTLATPKKPVLELPHDVIGCHHGRLCCGSAQPDISFAAENHWHVVRASKLLTKSAAMYVVAEYPSP